MNLGSGSIWGECGLRELDPGIWDRPRDTLWHTLWHEGRLDMGPASGPSDSQMQLLRDESSRKPSGHTQVYPPCVFAHSPCWQRPPVSHSSTSAREGVVPVASGASSQPAPSQAPPTPAPAHLRRTH